MINYPDLNESLEFSEYISQCKQYIKENRVDLNSQNQEQIINANAPFELLPNPVSTDSSTPTKIGLLMIHGLLDSPFSMRDLGKTFQAQGMHCRTILLQGHGTQPKHLLNVTYQDWLHAVDYGIKSFNNEVEKVYLVGYSTGAALSIYHALKNPNIAGIILIAPAVKIKISASLIAAYHYLLHVLMNDSNWLYKHPEIDYTKYLSITYNAVKQVSQLTDVVSGLAATHSLTSPVLMAVSADDETISAKRAIEFFNRNTNHSKLLIYATEKNTKTTGKVLIRNSCYPERQITNFSHVSLPFSASNPHYGEDGDYVRASHINSDCIYGAYNYFFVQLSRALYFLKFVKFKRNELTYNPDYDFMSKEMLTFIQESARQ